MIGALIFLPLGTPEYQFIAFTGLDEQTSGGRKYYNK
jgi:hypothetical protein